MESINKVELRGRVGQVIPSDFGKDNPAALRMSVATTYAYQGRDGGVIIDTTWHDVICWVKDVEGDASLIKKGDIVHVWGRIRYTCYTRADGIDQKAYQVLADRVVVENESGLSSTLKNAPIEPF